MSAQPQSSDLVLEPADNQRLASLCGQFDEHLRQVERSLGVEVNNRGNTFRIIGDTDPVNTARRVLQQLYAETANQALTPSRVQLLLQADEEEAAVDEDRHITTRRLAITPRGTNQRRYVESIRQCDANFGIGPAGTGKTYLAVACAVEALECEEVRRILLVRPAVEAGERLGFLPGDLAQKIDPYLRPLYDALYEMLGFDRTSNKEDPTTVLDLPAVVELAVGNRHACARTAAGALWCWGDNNGDQLGTGQTGVDEHRAVDIGMTDVAQVVAGSNHTCARKTDGSLWCWGKNADGQIGNGTLSDASTPLEILPAFNGAQELSVGDRHTCALLQDGSVSCWGDNRDGQFGNGTRSGWNHSPAQTWLPTVAVSDIVAGGSFTCFLHDTQAVSCTGRNDAGELGLGHTASRSEPEINMREGATKVVAGRRHGCALHGDGTVSCWGSGFFGQLGNGQEIAVGVPREVTFAP